MPAWLRRIEVSSSLLAARRIGDAVHTVLVSAELAFPNVLYPRVDPVDCPPGTTVAESLEMTAAALAMQRVANEELVAQTVLEQVLPAIEEDGRDLLAERCESVYGDTLRTGSAVTTLLSISLSETACSTWWTQSRSLVKRSVFMDNFVYSISRDSMRVQALDALALLLPIFRGGSRRARFSRCPRATKEWWPPFRGARGRCGNREQARRRKKWGAVVLGNDVAVISLQD